MDHQDQLMGSSHIPLARAPLMVRGSRALISASHAPMGHRSALRLQPAPSSCRSLAPFASCGEGWVADKVLLGLGHCSSSQPSWPVCGPRLGKSTLVWVLGVSHQLRAHTLHQPYPAWLKSAPKLQASLETPGGRKELRSLAEGPGLQGRREQGVLGHVARGLVWGKATSKVTPSPLQTSASSVMTSREPLYGQGCGPISHLRSVYKGTSKSSWKTHVRKTMCGFQTFLHQNKHIS